MKNIDFNKVIDIKEVAFCRIFADAYVNIANGTINNTNYKFNQSYELVYSDPDNFYYISNFSIISDVKFYKFQDNHTYKHFRTAFKNFIKLSKKL